MRLSTEPFTPKFYQMASTLTQEGEIEYLIGVSKRTPFRVLALSNPTRLVIDYKR
jgi:hypothetical protein